MAITIPTGTPLTVSYGMFGAISPELQLLVGDRKDLAMKALTSVPVKGTKRADTFFDKINFSPDFTQEGIKIGDPLHIAHENIVLN